MNSPPTNKNFSRTQSRSWFGRYPGRTLQRLGAAISGLWIGTLLFSFVWPDPDLIEPHSSATKLSLSNSPYPKQAIKLLLLGVVESHDSLNKDTKSNQLTGIISTLLINIKPPDQVSIVQVPLESLVKLPGKDKNQSLSSLYVKNEIKLFKDVVSEILGLKLNSIDRYIVVNSDVISELTNSMGRLHASTSKTLSTEEDSDRSFLFLNESYLLDRRKYLQEATEKFINSGSSDRRNRVKSLANSLFEQMKAYDSNVRLEPFLEKLLSDVDTNLSYRELMNLLSVVINTTENIEWIDMPLGLR